MAFTAWKFGKRTAQPPAEFLFPLAQVLSTALLGFGLAWDPRVFRYIWIWQALGGGIGYPWYGRTYNMGLEPWSSYPCSGLEDVVKRGTQLCLKPGEHIDVWLTAAALAGVESVSRIERDGTVRP